MLNCSGVSCFIIVSMAFGFGNAEITECDSFVNRALLLLQKSEIGVRHGFTCAQNCFHIQCCKNAAVSPLLLFFHSKTGVLLLVWPLSVDNILWLQYLLSDLNWRYNFNDM